jgi:ABC-type dipeptide/oligopeptide/nickel transport system permease component
LLWLVEITMSLVAAAAILVRFACSLPLWQFPDRTSPTVSQIGASMPDIRLAVVAIVIFSVQLA